MKAYIARLEAAFKTRVGQPWGQLRNVHCVCCGDNIPNYYGPKEGILCASCLEPNNHVLLNYGNLTPEDFTGDRDYELPD